MGQAQIQELGTVLGPSTCVTGEPSPAASQACVNIKQQSQDVKQAFRGAVWASQAATLPRHPMPVLPPGLECLLAAPARGVFNRDLGREPTIGGDRRHEEWEQDRRSDQAPKTLFSRAAFKPQVKSGGGGSFTAGCGPERAEVTRTTVILGEQLQVKDYEESG